MRRSAAQPGWCQRYCPVTFVALVENHPVQCLLQKYHMELMVEGANQLPAKMASEMRVAWMRGSNKQAAWLLLLTCDPRSAAPPSKPDSLVAMEGVQ